MITHDDLRLFEGCLDRMVSAKWIERYAYEAGHGISIQWTEDGRKIASLLKAFIKAYDLRSGPHEARLFDIICNDPRRQQDGIRPEIASYWRDCMTVLRLHRDDFDFACLVHMLDEFGPELESEIATIE